MARLRLSMIFSGLGINWGLGHGLLLFQAGALPGSQPPTGGATLIMTGIEPIGLVTDRRTFECDQCGHEEELLVNSFH
jgi:hypothetical protein